MRLTLKLATNYLLDLLKSGLKEKLNLEEGIAPTVEQLIENSYEEFVTNLQSYKLKYYDVISQASLKPNYEEELRRATFKLNRLLDSGLRENLNLKNNQAPSKQKLREFGHRSFLWDIYKKGLRYNQVVERAGLKPNTVRNKWKNFNLNEAANKLLEIVNSEKLKKINLPNGIAPSIRLLKENGYSDFWWAFKNKNFSYTDAVKNAGLKFQSRDIITEIGNSLHWILENIFMQSTRESKLLSFYEIHPSIMSNNYRKCDNSIIRNREFIKSIELNQNLLKIPDKIEMINIDYYFGSHLTVINKKSHKGYQGEKKFLIIVHLSNKDKKINTPLSIPYKKHVTVLNSKDFLTFMGYKHDSLFKFNQAIELAREAIYRPESRKKLEKLAKIAKKELKQKYNYSHKELEEFIESGNYHHLLEESPNNLSLDRWLLSESTKSKESAPVKMKTTIKYIRIPRELHRKILPILSIISRFLFNS